jgi:mevalonate kinase
MKFKGSAPGKIILFGEHAVVYSQPAIAVPVDDVQAEVYVSASEDGRSRVISKAIELDIALDDCQPAFWGLEVKHGVQKALGRANIPPFLMEVESTIPVASGLGSGAAVAAAAIRALSAFLEQPLDDKDVNLIVYETEKLHHGTPSGIDNTVITFARPVFFIREKPIETFVPKIPFTIVIADTGVPSPTALTVGDVRRARLTTPKHYDNIFNTIGEITNKAKLAIEDGNLHQLGILMNENHRWLYEIGVSCPELNKLVYAARSHGALGAKLSGGGRGGNMVALVEIEQVEKIAKALTAAGAVNTITTTIGE